jgi:hypothetical protein
MTRLDQGGITLKQGAPLMLACLAMLIGATCLSCEAFPEYDQAPGLLFQTGFAGTSVADSGSQTAKFLGADPGFSSLSNWSSLEGGSTIGTFFINFESGVPAQRYVAIAGDPDDALNPVAEFRINEPHIVEGLRMKGRVSAILERLEVVYGFSETIRLRLDPSLSVLESWESKIDWLTLFEFWSGDDDRLTVSLYKEAGSRKPLRWRITKDSLGWFGWNRQWEEVEVGHNVAFGSWMNMGIAAKVGEDGRARIWLGIEGDGAWTTLIDSTKAIGKPSGFTKLNPFKLYTSDRLIDFVNGRGASLSILWDDWKLWLNDGIAR